MLIDALEDYYDAVLRRFATVEEVGPFRLYLDAPPGWVFPARPRPRCRDGYDAGSVAAVLHRMRALGVPETVEWVHDAAPGLLAAVREEGSLAVTELPLLVLDGAVAPAAPPPGIEVRLLAPSEEDVLVPVGGVSRLAFGAPREVPAGSAERDAVAGTPSDAMRRLLRTGEARIAVAEHPERGVLAIGRHLPVGDVTEVVGVATLPAEQGAGLGSAVTNALVADAVALGIGTIFLTASSRRVADLYERLGFRRVGTCYEAERG